MKSLSEFPKNKTIQIKKVSCGQNLKRRLSELGLFEGSTVNILKNDFFGPLLIKILNSKIALGRGESNKIYGEEK